MQIDRIDLNGKEILGQHNRAPATKLRRGTIGATSACVPLASLLKGGAQFSEPFRNIASIDWTTVFC